MKDLWNNIVVKFNTVKDKNDDKMPLTMRNYVLMLIGVAVIVVGFVLMSGGTKATPDEFSYDIYSWRRITIAPILVVAGFAFEIYAILKRFGVDTTQKAEATPSQTAQNIDINTKQQNSENAFIKAIITCLKKYATFTGRASRSEYWYFVLFESILSLIPIVGTIAAFVLLIPHLAVLVRRLHDVGKSGLWYFIALIPIFGAIWLIILLVLPSQQGSNEYDFNK